MMLVNLVRWALLEETDEVVYVASVRFRPDIFWIIGREGLKWDERKETFLGQELYHFPQLVTIAAPTRIISKFALPIFG